MVTGLRTQSAMLPLDKEEQTAGAAGSGGCQELIQWCQICGRQKHMHRSGVQSRGLDRIYKCRNHSHVDSI